MLQVEPHVRERMLNRAGRSIAAGLLLTAIPSVPLSAQATAWELRRSLAGTYAVSLDRRMLSGTDSGLVRHLAHGHLVLLEKAGGFTAIEFTREWDSMSTVHVQSVLSSHTNPAGQVVFDFGADAMDGFQTAEGFAVQSAVQSQSGVVSRLELQAKQTTLPLSWPTGTYDLQARTAAMGVVAGKEEYLGKVFPFDGEAAVVVANDSIYITTYLRTGEGNASIVLLYGPVGDNGVFSLQNENVGTASRETVAAAFDGRVRSGRLKGNWRYGTRKAWVQGVVEGLRR